MQDCESHFFSLMQTAQLKNLLDGTSNPFGKPESSPAAAPHPSTCASAGLGAASTMAGGSETSQSSPRVPSDLSTPKRGRVPLVGDDEEEGLDEPLIKRKVSRNGARIQIGKLPISNKLSAFGDTRSAGVIRDKEATAAASRPQSDATREASGPSNSLNSSRKRKLPFSAILADATTAGPATPIVSVVPSAVTVADPLPLALQMPSGLTERQQLAWLLRATQNENKKVEQTVSQINSRGAALQGAEDEAEKISKPARRARTRGSGCSSGANFSSTSAGVSVAATAQNNGKDKEKCKDREDETDDKSTLLASARKAVSEVERKHCM